MASSRPTSQLLRTVTVFALAGAAVALPAAPGSADPATCADSRRQFVANGVAAEKVSEQLNDARIARVKVQKAYAVAGKRARAVNAEYGELAGDFREIVSGELKSAPAGQFAALFASGSPKDFADQMALMDYVAGRKGRKIDKLGEVRAIALKAQGEAQARLAARQRVEREIATKAADLRKRGATLSGLLSRLCAADSPAASADRASRSAARVAVGPASGGAQQAVQTALAQIGDPYVWGAGESRAMTAIRRHVRDTRGLGREAVSLVAYWRHPSSPPDD